jgi:hypothetical protein
MWGLHWGSFVWGGGPATPALGAGWTLVLGCLLGAFAVFWMRSSRRAGVAILALCVFLPLSAAAMVPFIFTNGQTADATQVNADFAAVTPIIGTTTVSTVTSGSSEQFVFPASAAFTAPRNMQCAVTIDLALDSGGVQLIEANTAVKINSTQSTGPERRIFLAAGPVVGSDQTYNASLRAIFSVPSGAAVSFGADIVAPALINIAITTAYFCD